MSLFGSNSSKTVPLESKEEPSSIWTTKEWSYLEQQIPLINNTHLRNVLKTNNNRNESLIIEYENITIDCTRQRVTNDIITGLLALAKKSNLTQKIDAMFAGEKINKTENRSALHFALRSKSTDIIMLDNVNQVTEVHKVLSKIQTFSNQIRNNDWLGFSGKPLTNVISIGIGGSYLGAEFIFEALKTDVNAQKNARGRQLRFYANIDPIAFARATANMNPEETLAIIISKSFTTRDTLMNASLIRQWFLDFYKNEKCLANHFIAVSANPELPISQFSINKENIFEFWDWVGGRYSVTSAVGILPLSIHYGYEIMHEFLNGANNIDVHFQSNLKSDEQLLNNIPILMGLMGIWNSSFLKYSARACIPYCEALSRMPAFIQQLDMESNGKRVDLNGNVLPFDAGEINFGETGTNAQHSFFQLLHQGQTIPVDFIGFCKSQMELYEYSPEMLELIKVNNDELMANMFAQSDALAIGKTEEQVRNEMKLEFDEELVCHKVFSGNRPSSVILFDGALNAYTVGQLLAIYEYRTIVQGFVWNIGSFDQWGVQLGKLLSKQIRSDIDSCKGGNDDGVFEKYHSSSAKLLKKYCAKSLSSLHKL